MLAKFTDAFDVIVFQFIHVYCLSSRASGCSNDRGTRIEHISESRCNQVVFTIRQHRRDEAVYLSNLSFIIAPPRHVRTQTLLQPDSITSKYCATYTTWKVYLYNSNHRATIIFNDDNDDKNNRSTQRDNLSVCECYSQLSALQLM